jgi:thiamine biosynthesis lipoprotein
MLVLGALYGWWLFVGRQQMESAHLRAAQAVRITQTTQSAQQAAQALAPIQAQGADTPSPPFPPPPAAPPAAPAASDTTGTQPSDKDEPWIARENYSAMGMPVDVQLVVRESQKPTELMAGVRAILAHVEHLYSNYDPTSFVSRLNEQAGGEPFRVAPEEREVFDELAAARRMSELTGGAFDITFESVGRFWRFDRDNPRLPIPEEMKDATRNIDYRRVIADSEAGTVRLEGKDTRINLGGIAKGVAVDQSVAYLKEHGVSAALLNVGGDFYGYGLKPNGKPWVVGLQHPRQKSEILPDIRIPVQDCAVFTSGDYERSFTVDGRLYHHIMDPRTAMPATGVVSVTAITKPPQYGLSLAIFVLGPEKGFALARQLKRDGIKCEAIVITDHGDMLTSDGLPEAWGKMHVDLSGEATAQSGPIGTATRPTSGTAPAGGAKPSAPARAVEVPGEP